jgi:hypothetical protein
MVLGTMAQMAETMLLGTMAQMAQAMLLEMTETMGTMALAGRTSPLLCQDWQYP